MKSLSAIFAIMLTGTLAVRADLPAHWSTNYLATLSQAESNQQPTLVYFTASWCGPCKLMTRLTLTDPVLVPALSGIPHVAVDIDEHPDLASKHAVNAVPTFVLLSVTGNEVARATGFEPIGLFLPWLTNSISEAKVAAARQALLKQELAEVDQLLASKQTNSDRLAAEKLFNLCASRDRALFQAANVRLRTLAARDPAVLLDGLDDPRLSTRIQTANALRYAIGDSFNVDPWSDAAIRKKATTGWREKLAEAARSKISH